MRLGVAQPEQTGSAPPVNAYGPVGLVELVAQGLLPCATREPDSACDHRCSSSTLVTNSEAVEWRSASITASAAALAESCIPRSSARYA